MLPSEDGVMEIDHCSDGGQFNPVEGSNSRNFACPDGRYQPMNLPLSRLDHAFAASTAFASSPPIGLENLGKRPHQQLK